jgi:hypothetical protein
LLPFGTSAAVVLAIHQIQLMAVLSFSTLRILIARESTYIFVQTYHSIIILPTLTDPYCRVKNISLHYVLQTMLSSSSDM